MQAWRERKEDVSAIQLASWNQVQRCDEKTYPSRDKDRVQKCNFKSGYGKVR